jgi:hypothetical protein
MLTIGRRRQLWELVKHFFNRFFDRDSISTGSDPSSGVVQMLALLAVPGLMLGFYRRVGGVETALPDHYFFVSYSMTVMGFLMVFAWDALFPDVRDYLILISLPIRYVDIFFAKVVALIAFAGLFVVDINFFSTLFFPNAGHVLSVFGGATFIALAFVSLQGILINVLSPEAFRRVSPFVQMISVVLLLVTFLLFSLISSSISALVQRSSPLLDYLPMFWFFGVYECFLPVGNKAVVFRTLELEAVYGLMLATLAFVVTYAIAYKRHARAVLEAIDVAAQKPNGFRYRFGCFVGKRLLKDPVQRACFRFFGAVLTRSPKHQMFLAVHSGIGLALALSSLFVINHISGFPFRIARNGFLELPLILSFFVISGIRATFNIPYELPANWIFRISEARSGGAYNAAIRKWVVLYGIVPALLLVAPLEFAYWAWPEALFHLFFQCFVSVLLLRILFANFHKIPFTCSFYPGKNNFALLAVAYLYGFTTYTSSMIALEGWLISQPMRVTLFLGLGSIAISLLLSNRQRTTSRLIFEEQSDNVVQSLGLN